MKKADLIDVAGKDRPSKATTAELKAAAASKKVVPTPTASKPPPEKK
ncbi:MAG TPA: hypothetical protein VLC92_11875 [Rhodocyclaceae bacterium]|nr:hypothetical protein [Rhodocyclaceae bacterium]